jgi:spore maturation protein CgeB
MKILFIGPELGTSLQRLSALRRLGHDVTVVDSYKAVDRLKLPPALLNLWIFKAGVFGLGALIRRYVLSQVKGVSFDFVLVDSGELLGAATIIELKKAGRVVANYNQDNPYVPRDGLKWRLFLKALPFYDLVATHRLSSAEGATRAGARNVLLVREAADEIVHRPIEMDERDLARFSSPVAFVGTWMPERGPFLLRLVERGVPLRIYGDRWHLAPEYAKLRSHVVLGNLEGDDYVKAIGGASIAIGLLSKGNNDLHTTRSFEIPAIGTLFCAERTSDHLEMYEDGKEAVFFDSADECADLCLALLAQPDCISEIAAAGLNRIRRNGDFNEKLLTKIIEAALKTQKNQTRVENGRLPN